MSLRFLPQEFPWRITERRWKFAGIPGVSAFFPPKVDFIESFNDRPFFQVLLVFTFFREYERSPVEFFKL